MRITKQSAVALIGSLATSVTSLATYNPGPSYSVGIPSNSQISSSSNGAIYFQLSAPTSYQWVGLGIGSQMAGATIFVMYADGKGNVTISARSGTGEVQPLADSSIQAGVTLLAGSGIVGSQMIANVKCTSCTLDSSATSATSPWIAAWNQGSAINSDSVSYSINQHGGNSYRQFQFDLTKASITTDSNPFVAATSTSPSGSSSAGSSPSSTPTSSSSSSDGTSSGGDGGSSGAVTVGSSYKLKSDYDKAHGIIMGVAVVLLFPIGAVLARLGTHAWVHGAWQLFSLAALIAGFAVGIKLAQMRSSVFGETHTAFGLAIVILFLLQPIFGIIHHVLFKRKGDRTIVSHVHIWYGRIIMILAVINGGLGLKLAANSKNGKIAYGVVAGVVGLAYILLVAFKRKNASPMSHNEHKESPNVSSSEERESERRHRGIGGRR